jgi:hypothetical protein
MSPALSCLSSVSMMRRTGCVCVLCSVAVCVCVCGLRAAQLVVPGTLPHWSYFGESPRCG